MLREFLILLAVEGKFLFPSFPEVHTAFSSCVQEKSPATLKPVACWTLLVRPGKIAFGEAQVINGVQQVGLATPFLPQIAYDAPDETERLA